MGRTVRFAGAPGPAPSSGFTLIEVIVVTVIIAVVVSATLLSVSVGERGQAQETSRRIVSLMNNLSAEAILTGVAHGLRWDAGARRLVAVRSPATAWEPASRFGAIQVPNNWSLRLSLGGLDEGVDLASLDGDEDEQYEPRADEPDADAYDDEEPGAFAGRGAPEPWVQFQPTGLWQPGGVLQIFVDQERQATLGWSATGRIAFGKRIEEELP